MLKKTRDKTREERLADIEGFRLFDDFLLTAVFNDDPECAEVLIRTILGRSDLKVTSVHTKHYVKNLYGQSTELDIFAIDTEGNPYDIEFQKDTKGAKPKRARLYSSIIDANVSNPGRYGEMLPESYVIFITMKDRYNKGLPIYNVNRMVEETGMQFDDKQHIMYVNGQNRSDTELGLLVQDFFCTRADEIRNEVLSKKVRYLKEDPKGVEAMMESYKDLSEIIAEETLIEVAENLISEGVSLDKIAKCTGLPIEDVRELAKEVS